MSVWVILATGQSLTKEDVAYVKGRAQVVAISNAHELAPWADCLVSHDRAWWKAHPKAIEFSGQRFCSLEYNGCKKYRPPHLPMGCNSGLMGMFLARDLGAKRIILLGFDMHGTHYFGRHPDGLKNTNEHRFKMHMRQFTRFDGVEVINCTPGSALKCYPFIPLREAL